MAAALIERSSTVRLFEISQVWGGGRASVIVGGVKPDGCDVKPGGEVRRCEQSLLWGRWHLGLCRVEQKEGQ